MVSFDTKLRMSYGGWYRAFMASVTVTPSILFYFPKVVAGSHMIHNNSLPHLKSGQQEKFPGPYANPLDFTKKMTKVIVCIIVYFEF